jgi:hypothetical protein
MTISNDPNESSNNKPPSVDSLDCFKDVVVIKTCIWTMLERMETMRARMVMTILILTIRVVWALGPFDWVEKCLLRRMNWNISLQHLVE